LSTYQRIRCTLVPREKCFLAFDSPLSTYQREIYMRPREKCSVASDSALSTYQRTRCTTPQEIFCSGRLTVVHLSKNKMYIVQPREKCSLAADPPLSTYQRIRYTTPREMFSLAFDSPLSTYQREIYAIPARNVLTHRCPRTCRRETASSWRHQPPRQASKSYNSSS
jgi:hypothetical protein